MITKQERFLDFLGQENLQFIIPVYQRPYAWTKRQCEELWDDIMRSGVQGTSHFMSMVLFREFADDSGLRKIDVIDGQQRIATMTIMLSAFEARLRGAGASAAPQGVAADDICARYLRVGADADPKIRLLSFDYNTLKAVMSGTELPAKPSHRVVENYEFFSKKFAEEGFDANVFWAGLQQLLVIDAELGEKDKAQGIFESLNTKGIPLTTADLVRNFLLVGETREQQEYLYKEYWNPIELMFGEDRDSLKLNSGLRMWLSIRYRKKHIRDKSQTYNVFKSYMTEEYDGTTEELLSELRSFCLMWAENFKFNEAKFFRSNMDWAKEGTAKPLLPEWGHPSGF